MLGEDGFTLHIKNDYIHRLPCIAFECEIQDICRRVGIEGDIFLELACDGVYFSKIEWFICIGFLAAVIDRLCEMV